MKGKEKVVVGVEEKRGRKEKVPREIGGWRRRKQFSNLPLPRLSSRRRVGSFFFLAQFTELYLKFESDSTILTYLSPFSGSPRFE